MKRHAARRDANEPEIVQALQRMGVQVWRHDTPMDLLCFDNCTKHFFWVEVKNPNVQNRRTQIQNDFIAATRGGFRAVIETTDETIALVNAIRNGEFKNAD